MYWIIFVNNLLLLRREDSRLALPDGEQPPFPPDTSARVLELPPLCGIPCRTFRLAQPPAGGYGARYTVMELRTSFHHLPAAEYQMAGKAAELLYWHENTRYCGRCGAPMAFHTPISKRCTECGKEVWPHVAPAIIVRIRRRPLLDEAGRQLRPEQILLVHARNFRRADYYGLVAGFVETGETLEDCVRREVREETSLSIENIRYFGSQPWPYPSGVMAGFTADYAGGELSLQAAELSRGGWFDRDHLPPVPDESSIARWLIDDWAKG